MCKNKKMLKQVQHDENISLLRCKAETILSDGERHCERSEAISETNTEDCHVANAPRNDDSGFDTSTRLSNRRLNHRKLRVAVIGTVGVPACYGGFESLVDNLLDFTPQNVEYTVFCSAKKYEKHLETYKGAKLIYLDRDANGRDSILYDFESMKMAAKSQVNADILLVLGVSGCVFLPYIRRIFKGKIITNIDGLEWRRDKWNFLAKRFLRLSEKMAVKYSDIVIGDNKGITGYVKDEYNKDAVLIAYGGDQVSHVTDDSLFEKYPFLKEARHCEPTGEAILGTKAEDCHVATAPRNDGELAKVSCNDDQNCHSRARHGNLSENIDCRVKPCDVCKANSVNNDTMVNSLVNDKNRHCEPTGEAILETKAEDCHVATAPRNDGNSFIPYSVTVCRIEPENNIHVILEAFSKLPNHTLLIVGNWEKSDYGKNLKEKYSHFQNIHLLDPVYEPHTINWLRSNAALYIHGHSAGGTNPSLVEAMNFGLPILAFDCVYNRATTEEKCLYWKNAEELESEVEEMLNQVQHDEKHQVYGDGNMSSLRGEAEAILSDSERHCERSEAISETKAEDCHVATAPRNDNNLRPSAKSAGDVISTASTGSTTASKIADAMLEVGKRLYTWKAIAEKYNSLY